MSAALPEDQGVRPDYPKEYTLALAALALLTLVNGLLVPLVGYWSVALLFLLGVAGLACLFSLGPAVLIAALSALVWNVLFIPPLYNLHIRSLPDLLMCLTYFIVAMIIAGLTSRLRAQEARVRLREQRLTQLYRFAGRLFETGGRDALLALAQAEIGQALNVQVSVRPSHRLDSADLSDVSLIRNQQVPLVTSSGHYGVIALEGEQSLDPGQQRLFETLCRQLALALEREALQEAATQTRLSRLSETLQDALFDSVSHELRTPLTTIQCSIDNLRHPGVLSQDGLRRSLLIDLEDASRRLSRVIANLLDMSRLQSGRLSLNQSWCDPGDIVRAAVKALEAELRDYPFTLTMPEVLPLIRADFGLIEQALLNLIHNACTHNPPGTAIQVELRHEGSELLISVCDKGAGISPESLPQIFDRFYRSPGTLSTGTGLGLSITQGFIEAHQGYLSADNAPAGGACFYVRLPVHELPALPIEEEDAPTHSDY